MSSILYILDSGHGGINPTTGKYVTPGKRSPKFDDGSVLYEGVNNRRIVKHWLTKFKEAGLEAIDLVDSWKDTSLVTRVEKANKLFKTRNCVYISVHSDAYGNGSKWTSPSGISVYTSLGQTASDPIADLVLQEFICNFEDSVKWRLDFSDGDRDKEAHFYVLRKTRMPAILIECGFHTNETQAKRMLTQEWLDKYTKSVIGGIKIWEHVYKK